ncbi:unnamed protein product [Rotaria sp. Silwood1]|nr:unnamed protein product [Rotaria sp. Silwood1]CAF0746255.1 unnamed protein product [Rotaria sp. Silwood1]
MSNQNSYDPYEELPSPKIELLHEMLSLPNIFDYRTTFTPPGIDQSCRSSLDSLSKSLTFSEQFSLENFEYGLDIYQCQRAPSPDIFGTTLPSTNLRLQDKKLLILAEPKAFYRDRYYCETDKTKNRAQRFIRAEDNQLKYEYPTVKIPKKWCDPTRQIYIRVTSVTIKSEHVPYHCIHPYEIDTEDKNVIKDPEHNSLYFPINEKEFITGEKSRKKMTQNDLKEYGPLRLFSSYEPDRQLVLNSTTAKYKITTYQLKKSQFIFTVAERHDNILLPIPILHTSAESQIMLDKGNNRRGDSSMNYSNDKSNSAIKCIPQKGDWQGGDEVLIIMSKPIKRKDYTICFDFDLFGTQIINEITHIDTKIILFRTPPCPILPGDENMKVSVVIKKNNIVLSSTDFYYVTPMKATIQLCAQCQSYMNDNRISNKRRYERVEFDSGQSLVSQMQHLSIGEENMRSNTQTSSDEKTDKFDKYLNQLQVALEKFVRTNDPSRLFRRTRILLSKCNESSPPLHDAIQRGHIQIALSLIEQVLDMNPSQGLLEKENENGETPLLIAAKCNQWKLIEPILKNRCDLAKQKDKDGNNLLHLLANSNEDESAEIIKNIFKILPDRIKTNLLKEKNKKNQRPLDIAQSHGDSSSSELLIENEK